MIKNFKKRRSYFSRPDANRIFKVPFYLVPPILGAMSCILLLFFLKINAIVFGGIWVLIGAVAYYFNKKCGSVKTK